jgi:preprotein translocase subunit SecG
MFTLMVILYVMICIFLILVVLVQQGRGADIAGAFGAGGSQQSFGPRGAATFLHKLTTGFFVAFVAVALILAIIEARPGSSVIKEGPKNPRAKSSSTATVPPTFPAPSTASPSPAPAAAHTSTPVPATATAPTGPAKK